jgi:hypothetical protein
VSKFTVSVWAIPAIQKPCVPLSLSVAPYESLSKFVWVAHDEIKETSTIKQMFFS